MSKGVSLKEIENQLKGLDVYTALQKLHHIQNENRVSLEKLIEKYNKKRTVYEAEVERFNKMCLYERDAFLKGYKYVAGIDEAGRGPLAGPVVAAAAILPENVFIEGLNDSKQVSAKKRDELFEIIKEQAVAYGIGIVDHKCIDEINILNATRKAMKIAVESLKIKPDLLLIDAEKVEDKNIEQISIIKGDTLSISIAAASILAKVTRDRMIDEMDSIYPGYGFSKHKGYGTKEHILAIKKFGLCPIHRITFTKNFV